jgi:hypothetical protein
MSKEDGQQSVNDSKQEPKLTVIELKLISH